MGIGLLHVKRRTRLKCGTLIENMSRTGRYDCNMFSILFDEFMRNSKFCIGVLHVKRQILTYFFVTSFLCSLQIGVYKKILNIFYI